MRQSLWTSAFKMVILCYHIRNLSQQIFLFLQQRHQNKLRFSFLSSVFFSFAFSPLPLSPIYLNIPKLLFTYLMRNTGFSEVSAKINFVRLCIVEQICSSHSYFAMWLVEAGGYKGPGTTRCCTVVMLTTRTWWRTCWKRVMMTTLWLTQPTWSLTCITGLHSATRTTTTRSVSRFYSLSGCLSVCLSVSLSLSLSLSPF